MPSILAGFARRIFNMWEAACGGGAQWLLGGVSGISRRLMVWAVRGLIRGCEGASRRLLGGDGGVAWGLIGRCGRLFDGYAPDTRDCTWAAEAAS